MYLFSSIWGRQKLRYFVQLSSNKEQQWEHEWTNEEWFHLLQPCTRGSNKQSPFDASMIWFMTYETKHKCKWKDTTRSRWFVIIIWAYIFVMWPSQNKSPYKSVMSFFFKFASYSLLPSSHMYACKCIVHVFLKLQNDKVYYETTEYFILVDCPSH